MHYRSWDYYKKMVAAIFLLALFTVLGTGRMRELGEENRESRKKVSDEEFRAEFFSESMRAEETQMSKQCRKYLRQVENEAVYFPVPVSTLDSSLETSYIDGYGV